MSTSPSENTDLQPIWWKNFVAQIAKQESNNGKCKIIFSFFFLLAFLFRKEIPQSALMHLYKRKLARKAHVKSNAVSCCLKLASFIMVICNILDCTNMGCFTQSHAAVSPPRRQVLELKEITKPTLLPSCRCDFRGHSWREKLEVSVLSVSPPQGSWWALTKVVAPCLLCKASNSTS